MRHALRQLSSLFAAGLALCATVARADDHPMSQHPAIVVHARPPTIDPNRFIVAPPATTTWVHGHANQEHPALQVARLALHAPVNSNTFTVQPPASVRWTLGPADDEPVALRSPPGALLR